MSRDLISGSIEISAPPYAGHPDPSINDLDGDPFAAAHSNGFDKRTDFLCNSALATYNLAHIAFGDTKFQNSLVFALDFGNVDLVRVIHKVLRNVK